MDLIEKSDKLIVENFMGTHQLRVSCNVTQRLFLITSRFEGGDVGITFNYSHELCKTVVVCPLISSSNYKLFDLLRKKFFRSSVSDESDVNAIDCAVLLLNFNYIITLE